MFATTTSRSSASRSSFSANSRTFEARSDKKFCGVCHKKGLAESVYTSHFTKSVPGEKGIVVCPTILSAICSYCNQKGHWANEDYCSRMKKDRRDAEYARKEYAKYPAKVSRPIAVDSGVRKNLYSALSAAVPAAAPVVEDFPALPSAKGAALHAPALHAPAKVATVSWADMANKPVREIAAIKEASIKRSYYYDTDRPQLTLEEAEAIKILEERIRSNPWAYTDCAYSDDEDDDLWEGEVLEDNSPWYSIKHPN